MRTWLVVLILAGTCLAQKPCVRYVNGLTSTSSVLTSVNVTGIITEGLTTSTIADLSPSNRFSNFAVVDLDSVAQFTIEVNGVFVNTGDAFGKSVILNEDDFYTITIYNSRAGEIELLVTRDNYTLTPLNETRVNIINVIETSENVITNSVLDGVPRLYVRLQTTDLETGTETPNTFERWTLEEALFQGEHVDSITFPDEIMQVQWAVQRTIAAPGAYQRADDFSLQRGHVYTLWFFGDAAPGVAGSSDPNLIVTHDSHVGMYIPQPWVPNPVSDDLCLGVSCEEPRTCRNGRCLLPEADLPLCRDYLGFDVVEVARYHLVETWSDMRMEIREVIDSLKKFKRAVSMYDPHSEHLPLVDYVWGLQSICSGRDRNRCPASQCEPSLIHNHLSTCSSQECEIPLSCVGLGELEFLQGAFLSAVTRLKENAGMELPSCLAPFSASVAGLTAEDMKRIGSTLRNPNWHP